MNYSLLVFDWDGTVIDSIGTIVSCVKRALGDLEIQGVSDQSIRATIGLGFRETVESFLPGATDETFHRIVERYRHHWIDTFDQQSQVYSGTHESLRLLSERSYLLAVATGKSRRGLNKDLERTGLGPLFAQTKTVDEARSKPDPQMLLDLLEELGQKSSKTLMIGDTTHDLDMARNAGVPALAVTSGSHSREELASRSPIAILASVADLPQWLSSQAT